MCLAALSASLQTPSQPGEVGNRGLKNRSKMASLLGRELIDVDVSRRRSQSCEAEFQRPRWLVWCWWLTGRSLQYLIIPSCGVRPDQHEMIDLPRRATKPNRNMHGAGQVCRHQTVGGPAGSRDLSAGRLVTKVGGRDGSHTNHLLLSQRLSQHLLPRNHPDRRRTHRSVSPLRWASPVVPGPNPGDTHTHFSSHRGHGQPLITEIQDALRVNLVPRCTPATQRDTGPVQPNRHPAVVDPKLGTDPAQRPAGGIELDRSVHIHDRQLRFGGSRQLSRE
jgi:hypothetical protein